jgi:hypothetical protein
VIGLHLNEILPSQQCLNTAARGLLDLMLHTISVIPSSQVPKLLIGLN